MSVHVSLTALPLLGSLLLASPAPHRASRPPPPPASPSPATADPPPPRLDAEQVEAALTRLSGPSLHEVQRAALRESGLAELRRAKWLRRSRSAFALPTLSAKYDHRLDRGWTLDSEAGQADGLRTDAGAQGVVRVKATWELDRLVFSPDELRAARALLDVEDVRERVLIEVTTLYFERQRLLLERELAPSDDPRAVIESTLRLREVEGVLEGLTGLSFAAP